MKFIKWGALMKKKAWLRDFHASGFLGLLIYESAKKNGWFISY